METARNLATLAAELGIPDVVVAANKVRDATDHSAIADFCRAHELRLVGEVPYDARLADAERGGDAPIELAADSPGVTAIVALAEPLFSEKGARAVA